MKHYTVDIYRVMTNGEYLLAHISNAYEIRGWMYVPMDFTTAYIMYNVTCLWKTVFFTLDERLMDKIEKMYSMDLYV